MSDSLTTRLLAEIERREEVARPYVIGHGSHGEREAAYLAALRAITLRHSVYFAGGEKLPVCAHCERRYPCVDLLDVAEALDVTP